MLNGPEPHLQSVTSAPSYSLEQPTPVYSNFAGAFFLVNVLLAQGLYPDFTRPRDKGFAVPLWQLLALVSLRLAGWRLRGDPLWLLLLQLEPANATDDCRDLDAFWVPPTPMRPPRGADILSRWLNGFVRWLRPNLSESLGWSLREVGLRLLSARARIWATASEISVIYSLQDHPVEVRLAGLDRDPGYLPSVGRKLRFFFE